MASSHFSTCWHFFPCLMLISLTMAFAFFQISVSIFDFDNFSELASAFYSDYLLTMVMTFCIAVWVRAFLKAHSCWFTRTPLFDSSGCIIFQNIVINFSLIYVQSSSCIFESLSSTMLYPVSGLMVSFCVIVAIQ